MLDDKTSLSKLKRIEIINTVISAYNGMKLPTKKNLKLTNIGKLNNILLPFPSPMHESKK